MKSSIQKHIRRTAGRHILAPLVPTVCFLVLYLLIPVKVCQIIFLLFFIASTICLLISILLFLFPSLSSSYFRLKPYGNPEEIIQDVEKELTDSIVLSQDKLILTSKYLVEFTKDTLKIIPLESVLWVFHLQNLRYSLKERKERMVFSLRITTISDRFTLRDYRKKDLDKILEVLTDHYPNFFYGYSDDHDKMVNYILRENKKELKEKKRR